MTRVSDITTRCVCGKRYRVRNATPESRLTCPDCGSLIEITEADFETEFAADGSIVLNEERLEARDAILVSDEPVRLAARGSRPGLTGEVAPMHEEALAANALAGRPVSGYASGAGPGAINGPEIRRTFLADLMSSLYFAGKPKNAAHLAISAVPASLCIVGMALIPLPFTLIVILPWMIVAGYIAHYYWLVLRITTAGEDEVPWFASDWSMVDDVLWPSFWMIGLGVICSGPGIWVSYFVPEGPLKSVVFWVAMAAGWYFWPMAILLVNLGGSILSARPDWVIVSTFRIGPVYFVAWITVMLTIVLGYALNFMPLGAAFLSGGPATAMMIAYILLLVAGVVLNLYFGYIMYRTIGLIYRHFRTRLAVDF